MSNTIHYLSLGDSLTVGFGAPPGLGFADQYRALLEQRTGGPVILVNRGINGAKTIDLCNLVKTDSTVKEQIREADLITITAGGNDMLAAAVTYSLHGDKRVLKQTIKACRTAYSQLFAMIHSYKQSSARPYTVRVADLYNPIPFFEESVLWILLFNRMLRSFQHPTLTISDMYTPFVGREKELLFTDRIHPNEEGYRVMAERLAACGPGPLIEVTA